MSVPIDSTVSASPKGDATSELATDLTTQVDNGQAPRHAGNWLLVAVTVLAAALLGYAAWRRAHAEHAAAAFSAANLMPTVAVAITEPAARGPELSLPATAEPFQKAEIFARAGGYVKRWRADIGQAVVAGEVLADIETPDLNQDVRKAEADVAQAEANLALARASASRYGVLMKEDAISRQEYDTKQAQLQASQAALRSAQAALARERDLMQFQSVTAPFPGIITARRIQVGDLVTTSGNGPGLFTIEQIDQLRVYVDLPQTYAKAVKPGMTAQLTIPEQPERAVTATVVRTAGAIAAATRTMRVELNVPNRDGALIAGGFVQVHLSLPTNPRALRVPVTAVRFSTAGPRVMVVDGNGGIRIVPVTLGRDLGMEFEITGGLQRGDRVVRNPTDGLSPGVQVHVMELAKP